jgi:general secretion pathway protein G
MGWMARDYDDEPDATSWGGDGLYDVYSSSELTALDGTKHFEW